MSARDKKLLIVLAGFVILALSYFLVFTPQMDKKEELEAENDRLTQEYRALSALAANADEYAAQTETMGQEMQEIYDKFPSYLQIEDEIMNVVNLENLTKSTVSELTIGDPVAVDVTASGVEGENTSDSADTQEETTEETAETATDDTTNTDDNKVSSSVMYYQLYDVTSVITFQSDYNGMKTMISTLVGDSKRKTISTLNLTFDSETGMMNGDMLFDSYYLYGLDKPYEPPRIPAIPHGTNNLFGTTN